jgi:hypothetical protein
MKHGNGELYLPSGTVIRTKWEHGMMHGPGQISHCYGKTEEVTYYRDLEIKMAD